VPVLGCCVSTALNEEPRQTHMTPFECSMQRSRTVRVMGYWFGAVVNEELG